MPTQIEVEGLTQLVKALKEVETELPKELRRGLKPIAEKVAAVIRTRLPSRTGKTARYTKASATQKSASIVWPRNQVPGAGPLEFGGWPPGREYIAAGRYIYPTVETMRPDIEQDIVALVDGLIATAGLD